MDSIAAIVTPSLLLERITPWLKEILDQEPKEHADLLDRFTRWQLLRRLRLLAERDKITRSSVQNARHHPDHRTVPALAR